MFSKLISALFHFIWYRSVDTWARNTFLGYRIQQCPLDLQIYQELIFKHRPDLIIQTGVAGGGSIMFFAAMLDAINAPPWFIVVGIDIILTEEATRINHPRIRLIEGSSTDFKTIENIRPYSLSSGRALVILDSDHSECHVRNELILYQQFVPDGSYLVVEDTNVRGPRIALNCFLKNHGDFENSGLADRNLISFHSWLKRNNNKEK